LSTTSKLFKGAIGGAHTSTEAVSTSSKSKAALAATKSKAGVPSHLMVTVATVVNMPVLSVGKVRVSRAATQLLASASQVLSGLVV
jgi:hypothetical protein